MAEGTDRLRIRGGSVRGGGKKLSLTVETPLNTTESEAEEMLKALLGEPIEVER